MSGIIQIKQLNKTYNNHHQALHRIDLDIKQGEIFALLGPNGAGKTTLISIICGLVNKTAGTILIDGIDNAKNYRQAREKIGLVPQELSLGAFDRVWSCVSFSRGLFGKKPNDDYLNQLLHDLSLYDKKHEEIRNLSGGMKRRVLIAKALSHEPKILFLDEPTAGVDVELRKDMWNLVEKLRQSGVTVILTTHYIKEAEAIADRVGIINKGKVILVEDKHTIMKQLGKKQLRLDLTAPIKRLPEKISQLNIELSEDKHSLFFHFTEQSDHAHITEILQAIHELGIEITELQTSSSSLEDIFVNLVTDQ